MKRKTKPTRRLITAVGTGLLFGGCAAIDHQHDEKDVPAHSHDEVYAQIDHTHADATIQGCYRVIEVPGASPHLDEQDEFCIRRTGRNRYVLLPEVNMDEWTPKTIMLTPVEASTLHYTFTVIITDHMADGSHTSPEHNGFEILFDGAGGATITGVKVDRRLHGGTAHSVW